MSGKLAFAVVLSGAGMKDGSEIHESVSALLAISNAGGEYQCFAPDITFDEVNYLTGAPTGAKRRVMLEAARIARGNIKDLREYNPADFDILVFPGGAGAIKNLCSFAYQGVDCEVNSDVKKAILETHELGKPIVALCIAPVLVARVLKGSVVTVGNDEMVGEAIAKMGGTAESKSATEITVDKVNKIVTTPCYMLAQNVSEVFTGVDKAIKAAIDLI